MRSLIAFIAADWRLTKARASEFVWRVHNYRYFRRRGFTMRAAWFNAMNVL